MCLKSPSVVNNKHGLMPSIRHLLSVVILCRAQFFVGLVDQAPTKIASGRAMASLLFFVKFVFEVYPG